MNELVIFSLIILLSLRIIGLGTSLNFFYDLRKNIFLYFIFGWTLAIIGNILPLILVLSIESLLSELILVFNPLLAALSSFLLMIGVFSYYLKIKRYILYFCIFFIIFAAVLLYLLLDYNISISFTVLILNLTLLASFIYPLLKLQKWKDFARKSIRWYYITSVVIVSFLPISSFILLQGEGYGLYYSDNNLLIILNYSVGILMHILLILFLIHLEFTLSNKQQNKLKDAYSHNLGNIMQVINSSSDLISMTADLSEQEKKNLNLIQEKCKEASKLIRNIRKL